MVAVGKGLTEPVLAMFCRYFTKRPWPKSSIIFAGAYAHYVCQIPKQLAEVQHEKGAHPRRAVAWQDFDASPDRSLTAFVEAAALPEAERPQSIEFDGKTWQRIDQAESNTFWAAYQCGTESIIGFRSGNGRPGTPEYLEDAQIHPGSPARAFIQGTDAEELPEMPVELVQRLGRAGRVSTVGYSMGGIPALASALKAGDALERCVLYNPSMIFWPPWYAKLLPENWWTIPPSSSGKITSWVVCNDPLSEGFPGGPLRAPQTPGTTFVLPTCTEDYFMNHLFDHFLEPLPRDAPRP